MRLGVARRDWHLDSFFQFRQVASRQHRGMEFEHFQDRSIPVGFSANVCIIYSVYV